MVLTGSDRSVRFLASVPLNAHLLRCSTLSPGDLCCRELELFPTKLWSRDALKELCFEAQTQEVKDARSAPVRFVFELRVLVLLFTWSDVSFQYKANKVIVADNKTDEWVYICMQV